MNAVDASLYGYAPKLPSLSGATPQQTGKVAQDFEASFLSQMMEAMMGDSLGADAFGDGESSDIYKGMLMDQYGKIAARSGGIGIADYVKRELLSLQEKRS